MKPTLATPPGMATFFASHQPDFAPVWVKPMPVEYNDISPITSITSTASSTTSNRLETLSKSILTSSRVTPALSLFIATLVHKTWHDATTPPSRSFVNFTSAILKSTSLPFSVVLLALLLIDRLKQRQPRLCGAEGSECRLFVSSLMLSMKFLLDNTYTNRTWERVSGIAIEELNVMEMEFLTQLQFDIHVTAEEYFHWLQEVEAAVRDFKRKHQHQQQQQQAASILMHTPLYTQSTYPIYTPPPTCPMQWANPIPASYAYPAYPSDFSAPYPFVM